MSSKIKPITIYLLIGVLIILISIKAAFGYQEDFNAYALSKNLYICACSHTENTLTVENTGDVASTYSVKQEGTAMPFSSLSPTTFTLKPGETKQIHNFINVPCGIEGKYNLITIIDTIFGTSKELVQEIEVKKCINIDLSLKEQPAEVCPCTPAKYTFIIKNTGDFTETYYIEAAPTPKYVSISEKVVVLEAGKSKEIYVFVNAPCGFFGEQEYSLIATTQKSKVKAELPFKTIIAPCYDYSITSPDYFLVCSDLKNTYSLLISNNANVANSYYLSSDSNWVFFDQPYINLSKKQNTQANVTFYPVALPKGEYNVTLRSVSERGQLVVEKPVIANVDNCYSLNLSLEQIAPAVSCEQVITKVLVNNDGAKENTYTLSLIGEPWAGISLTSLSLKPGEIKESLIKFDVPCDAYGTYHFSILGSMSNFPEKVLQQPLDLVIQSPEEAYAIEINSVDDKIETNYDGAVIPLTISSKGIRAGYYDLLLDTDQEWMYLDKQSINLGIGDNQTISLILSPSNETLPGNYEISIKAIPKDKGIGYERQFVVKLREKTLGETLIEVWPYLLLGLLIPVLLAVLIILIIYKSKKKKEEDFWKVVEGEPSKVIETVKEEPKRLVYVKKERKWLRILLITLITLLLVGTFALVIYYFTPSTEEVEEGANETGITEANITEIPSESKEEANITEEGIFHKMYSYAHNWISNKYRQIFAEEVEEEKPQENISEEVKLEEFEELGIENATIYINRTGLRGEGNIIEIGPDEEIIIPITIQNNYEPNIYRIKVNKNVSWIDVDKNEVEIPPNQKETINLIVGPTKATEEGNYKIDIVINVEGKPTPIIEEIELNLSSEKPWYIKYMWYAFAGLLALLLLLITKKTIDWSKEKKASAKTEIKEKEKREAEGEKRISTFKIFLIGIIILLLLAGIIFVAIYFGSGLIHLYANQTTGTEEPSGEIQEKEDQKTETAEVLQNIPYEEINLQKGVETIIPIKITNANETSIFNIKINDNVDWISVDKDFVIIQPNQSEVINLVASPTEQVDNGVYNVIVDIAVNGKEGQYIRGFRLNVNESKRSALLSYLLYILAGIVVLCTIIYVLKSREKKVKEGRSKKEDETKEKEDKRQIKKTKISLE